ncbi:hypothetical protein [Pontivivens nitratireducens]|nr:hypothetical protein [Pontibrevibacter nitratireducens]
MKRDDDLICSLLLEIEESDSLGMMRDIAVSYVKQEAAEKLGIKL